MWSSRRLISFVSDALLAYQQGVTRVFPRSFPAPRPQFVVVPAFSPPRTAHREPAATVPRAVWCCGATGKSEISKKEETTRARERGKRDQPRVSPTYIKAGRNARLQKLASLGSGRHKGHDEPVFRASDRGQIIKNYGFWFLHARLKNNYN